jgi:hypothetical protein
MDLQIVFYQHGDNKLYYIKCNTHSELEDSSLLTQYTMTPVLLYNNAVHLLFS